MVLEDTYASCLRDGGLDFKKHIVKGDTIVYKASGSFYGSNHGEVMSEIISALLPYVESKDKVAITCAHSKNNLQTDIPKVILDSLDLGLEVYNLLPNKTKIITLLYNDLNDTNKAIWEKYRREGAPVPKTYKEKIIEATNKEIAFMSVKQYGKIRDLLNQKNRGNRTGHSMVQCFDKKYELDALSSKIKIIQFFERTLKNETKDIFTLGCHSNKIIRNGDIYQLNLEKTGSNILIGRAADWNNKTGSTKEKVDKNYCSITPICRMMQAAELNDKKELEFDTVINCFPGTEYECQGKFAEIFFRLFEPKDYLDLINIYFYEAIGGGLNLVYDYYTTKQFE
ncbi:MAG: hypothetical protein ABIF85_02120 [Nanoarchaeota archaeon]|nr:hypothetical protein [Nanoarchaeota archaeon]MBU4300862.1 hypothetical protein [Nanoarchaeota archaeon]MBU4451432.1 hypothetical protein [Nanoarchaeota archaeon]MCG2724494.1 hypothetical protein [archaeon]